MIQIKCYNTVKVEMYKWPGYLAINIFKTEVYTAQKSSISLLWITILLF